MCVRRFLFNLEYISDPVQRQKFQRSTATALNQRQQSSSGLYRGYCVWLEPMDVFL